jgi:hypothetical protein
MKIFSTSILAVSLFLSAASQAELLMNDVNDRVSRSNETLSYTFSNLSDHDSVSLNFDFFMFDSWDLNNAKYNDTFAFSVDQHQKTYGPTSAAWGGNPRNNPDLVQGSFNDIETWGPVDVYFENFMGGFTFAHSADTLTLSFTGSYLQAMHDESWAVDSINLSTNSGTPFNQSSINSVPIPFLLGGLLLPVMLFGRKRT